MHSYQHIPSLWRRDSTTKKLVVGEWTDDSVRDLVDSPWNATQKIDGTGTRIGIDDNGHFFVKGRGDKSQIPVGLAEHCRLLEDVVRSSFSGPVCLYGEGIGKGIQKDGHLYSDTQRFVIFDVRIGRFWLLRDAVEDISKRTEIPCVPVVHDVITLSHAADLMLSEPPESLIYDGTAEGWVLRPVTGLLYRDGSPIRVKMKERDFAQLRAA